MRLIGTVATESDARRLGDFLLTIGLPNHVEANNNGDAWLIWIERDDDIEQGQLRLREFQANPNDPRYAAASSAAQAVRRDQAKAADRRRRNYTDVRTSFSGVSRFGTPVTIAIVLLCGFFFVLQQTEFADEIRKWMLFYEPRGMTQMDYLRTFGVTDSALLAEARRADADAFTLRDAFALVLRAQVWRLVSPALLHANIAHLIFNMWAFLSVASMIESRKGLRIMLALTLLGAILSCSAQATWDSITPGGGAGFVGLSGVVYTVFGYAWIRGRIAAHERIGLAPQQISFMLAWLLLCMTGLIGPIANMAHFAGLLVGMAIGYWPRVWRTISQR